MDGNALQAATGGPAVSGTTARTGALVPRLSVAACASVLARSGPDAGERLAGRCGVLLIVGAAVPAPRRP